MSGSLLQTATPYTFQQRATMHTLWPSQPVSVDDVSEKLMRERLRDVEIYIYIYIYIYSELIYNASQIWLCIVAHI